MKPINNIEIKRVNSVIDYMDSLKFMEKRAINISSNKQRELIWFLSHNNIYTLGTSGTEKDIHGEPTSRVIKLLTIV